ncbi:MAG: DAK2 domain-containing protein, partial [Clostridia bacterium]|nr:DAK2 domain-containing protein [Clostridia bacterium]
MKTIINGNDYKLMVLNAAAVVGNQKQALNDLNVFPVPDGDTGTNMSMTLNHAVKDLAALDTDRLGKVAEKAAMSLTRGSHGNSGVITSLLFAGMGKSLKELAEANTMQFAAALKAGVDRAYSVVNKPAEGTILTVARLAAEAACANAANCNFEQLLELTLKAANAALAETPKQNSVLAKAGVVDAGGKGWCHILEGILAAIRGTEIDHETPVESTVKAVADFSDYDTADIKFGYCTEFIVLRNDPSSDSEALRTFLDSLGDSLVLVADEEIIKVHVHTNNPGVALEEALKHGALSSIKIENMREQHTEKLAIADDVVKEDVIAAPEKRYGFVAVAAGEGVKSVFTDLGVDNVVEGGQTMNPSTEDILRLINKTPAEVVFVLPNNKNII